MIAEVIRALEGLNCKYSYQSCASKNLLLQTMFPDSKIAQEFTSGKTYCSYLLCYGIAHSVPAVQSFVLLFDESFNYFS